MRIEILRYFLEIKFYNMKIKHFITIVILMLAQYNLSQCDTLFIKNENIILSSGEIHEPGKLPISNSKFLYSYYRVSSDSSLVFVIIEDQENSTLEYGYYRNKRIILNDNQYCFSWEKELFWLVIDNKKNTKSECEYNFGLPLNEKKRLCIHYL